MFATARSTVAGFLLITAGSVHVFGQGYHDIGVEVKVPTRPSVSGQPFKFTVVVTNAGPGDAYWVWVTVQRNDVYYMPEDMWFLSWPSEFEDHTETLDTTIPNPA